MEGQGSVVARKAPEFTLYCHTNQVVRLSDYLFNGPVMLVFYPKDFTMVCTKQLCNYRDNLDDFKKFGIQILAISSNPIVSHAKFAEKYELPFPLLTDPGNLIAKSFGCTSLLMLGNVSRAVFILNKKGIILYRYVEPTILTRRTSDELVNVMSDLRTNGII